MPDAAQIFRQMQTAIIAVRANLFAARPGECTALHRHPRRWHVSYTTRGRGAAIINGVRHAMRPGVIVMIYPNEPHLYAADQRNPYTVYHVHIDCAAGIPQIFPRTVRAAALDRNSLAGFQRLAHLTHHCASPTRDPQLMANLWLLLAKIYDLGARSRATAAPAAMPPCAPNASFSAMLERLQQAPFHFPGIARLAADMRMSRRHFTRCFRHGAGMSVRAYYLAGLMAYARNLMELKEYSLKEIAWQCGYANSQNFHRAYKRYLVQVKKPPRPRGAARQPGRAPVHRNPNSVPRETYS